ncbi:unnamed protein product [Victoria cruziana]
MFLVSLPLSLSALLLVFSLLVSTPTGHLYQNQSFSLPLFTFPLSSNSSAFSLFRHNMQLISPPIKSGFSYHSALFTQLAVGSPPQIQYMMLDTASDLTWVPCGSGEGDRIFIPSSSQSFSPLGCSAAACWFPREDGSILISCSNQYICQYSFSYTNTNQPVGYFALDVINFPRTSYPGYRITFGCRSNSTELTGVLGLNLGTLSFAKQSNIPRFSYCIPRNKPRVPGTLIIGNNPSSTSFKYTKLQRMAIRNLPYYDYGAYSLKIQGIMVGNRILNISSSVFETSGMGAGQTIISSAALFTHLVMDAYREVRREFLRQNWKLVSKVSTMYAGLGGLDLCFELGLEGSNYTEGLSGVVLLFDGGVELRVERDKLLAELEPGLWCFTFGGTDLVGLRSTIIGTYHQQDVWVEYDIDRAAVGFAPADCSK